MTSPEVERGMAALSAGVEPARLRLEGAALSSARATTRARRGSDEPRGMGRAEFASTGRAARAAPRQRRTSELNRTVARLQRALLPELYVLSDRRESHPRSWFGRPVPNCSATVTLVESPGNAPDRSACKAKQQPSASDPIFAPRTGIEPVSPLRQRGCDASRITRQIIALSSRIEREHIGLGGRAPNPSARALVGTEGIAPSPCG